jgi:hypothetical protein
MTPKFKNGIPGKIYRYKGLDGDFVYLVLTTERYESKILILYDISNPIVFGYKPGQIVEKYWIPSTNTTMLN